MLSTVIYLMSSEELTKILQSVKTHCNYYRSLGMKYLSLSRKSPVLEENAVAGSENTDFSLKPYSCLIEQFPSAQQNSALLLNQERLTSLKTQIGDCRLCRLCEKRTNIVFGEGNPGSNIVFVGEGPGEDEDIQARPFVGRAGQLLTKIIEAMQFKRSEVYIANIIKCRPPGNRNPEPDEIKSCLPFLQKQLEIISPGIVVAMGNVAAKTLLGQAAGITELRGKFFTLGDMKVMPTYHPSYLLRNQSKKKETWIDLKLVMEEHTKSRR